MCMNHFLSLTLSHHYPSVMSTLRPHSFPSVMRSGLALFSAFSDLVCPLPSASPFVWLVTGDGQHMGRLWNRSCPAESTGHLCVVEDIKDARLKSVGGRCCVWSEICCGGFYFYARRVVHVQDLGRFWFGCWLRNEHYRCLCGEVWLGTAPVEFLRVWSWARE